MDISHPPRQFAGMIRAFIALPLPEPTCDTISKLQSALHVGRAVPPENLHLTLAFLDDQPEPVLEELHYLLAEIESDAVDLAFDGLNTFGGRHPRLMVLNVKKTGELAALQARIASCCRQAGIELERRKFRPHVTVTRFSVLTPDEGRKLASYLGQHGADGPLPCRVDCFALYRSVLNPNGARYDQLATYQLAPRP